MGPDTEELPRTRFMRHYERRLEWIAIKVAAVFILVYVGMLAPVLGMLVVTDLGEVLDVLILMPWGYISVVAAEKVRDHYRDVKANELSVEVSRSKWRTE